MPDRMATRLLEIIAQLLEEDKYITLQMLADKLNVSKRTIQHDVERIDEWLVENGLADKITFSKKTGSGIRLAPHGTTTGEVKELLDRQYSRNHSTNHYERRLEIAKFLLFSQEDLTLQFLADQFYVSKSVINNDVVWVGKWLMQYGLGVAKRQNCGVRICGNEQKRRSAMAGLVDLTSSLHATGQNEVPIGNDVDIIRLDLERFYNGLTSNPKADVGVIAEIIHEAEKKYTFYLMDSYYTGLLVHLTIAVERLIGGCGVEDSESGTIDISEFHEGEIADYIAQRMEDAFHIQMPGSERSYICIHVMGAELPDPTRQNEMHSSRISKFTMRFVSFVEAQTGISFLQDETLLVALATHIKTSVFRMRSGLTRPSHYTTHIAKEYEPLYHAVWASGYYYKQFFHTETTYEEQISIYLHFVHSMRRRTHRCRTIFLYHGDIIQAEEIYQQLGRLSDEVEVCDICNWNQQPSELLSNYDMVLATNCQVEASIPVVNVSNPIGPQELELIRQHAHAICVCGFRSALPAPFLSPEISWTTLPHTNIEGVFEALFDLMTQDGFSSAALSRESIELERDGRTLVKNDVAFIPLYLPGVETFRAYGFLMPAPITVADSMVSKVLFLPLDDPKTEGFWVENQYPGYIRGILQNATGGSGGERRPR